MNGVKSEYTEKNDHLFFSLWISDFVKLQGKRKHLNLPLHLSSSYPIKKIIQTYLLTTSFFLAITAVTSGTICSHGTMDFHDTIGS